jgi:hypothetical protein
MGEAKEGGGWKPISVSGAVGRPDMVKVQGVKMMDEEEVMMKGDLSDLMMSLERGNSQRFI